MSIWEVGPYIMHEKINVLFEIKDLGHARSCLTTIFFLLEMEIFLMEKQMLAKQNTSLNFEY